MPEAATKKADALVANLAQQPPDAVAGCTQHGMNRISGLTFEVTTIHWVIGLQMPDDGFDGLTATVMVLAINFS